MVSGKRLMPLSKIVPTCWAVIGSGTLGILTVPFFSSVDSAIAQTVFTNPQLLAHSHVVIEPDSSSALEGENSPHRLPLQPTTTNQPSSPWGDPYTGNGTSTDARGTCHDANTPLIALMPDINSGRSVSSYPTFWFYVPYDSETISRGTFVLQDKEHNEVMEPLEFTLSNTTPGFVSLTFPQDVPPLKANVSYRWFFELYCEDDRTPVYVNGWIEKINLEDTPLTPVLPSSSDGRLSLGQPLRIESPSTPSQMELYSLYRQNFIWFDAVNAILQEWSETPDDGLTEELLSLLQSANVGFNTWPENVDSTPVRYD